MPDRLNALKAALADRYAIERELGLGGMATVYLALDRKHERKVALKVMRPELAAAMGPDRFLNEIRITATLQHPHILPLLDSGEAEGVLYYVMPYVEGESLREKMNREGRVPVEDALAITREVGAALDYAHRHDIIHRDIKPENILLHEGGAIVADFGVALAVSAAAGARLTETGLAIGTPAYMSPEQITGERDLDARSDLYALACMLYEMLTGEPPLTAESAQALIAKRITEPVPSAREHGAEIPADLDRAIARALERLPNDRFATVATFLEACELAAAPRPARASARLVPVLAVLAVVAVTALVFSWQRLQRERARGLLLQIEELADAGRYLEAYGLTVRAERRIAGDSMLTPLLHRVADWLTVTTDPAGAAVSLQRFAPDSNGVFPPATSLGVTPIRDRRVPRGDYRVVIEKRGFAALERMASSASERAEHIFTRPPYGVELQLTLAPAGQVPGDMLLVPGGRYQLVSPDMPTGLVAELAAFYIDRYEVTSEKYRAFLLAGGYSTPSYWTHPFTEGDRVLSFREAMGRFTDRTGLPGPRSWSGQEYPSERGNHPVAGISWYEAAAYCEFTGNRLPTVFEWEKTARAGDVSHVGVMMPWGYIGLGETIVHRANFSGSGTVPVDAYPFGISSYGAYNMAGNVKEWMLNRTQGGYVVTGGSWEDPTYLYSEYGALEGLLSLPSLGFRCARAASDEAGDQGAGRIDIDQRTPTYTPVDRTTFRALLSHYRYDRQQLEPRIVETVRTVDWTRETVRFNGVRGDTITAYVYLPHLADPPYQTIVHVPSGAAFIAQRVPDGVVWLLGANIKAGRAVFAVVFKGMLEREWEQGHARPETGSVQFRDEMVLHATELRLGLDYLETRDDIDASRLAYVGLSWSAGSRLPLAAVDDRFRAVVLIGGGIDERMQPTLPEASNINFAPYIGVPTLLLNGRSDEEHPWYTRALPLWNLLSEPKRLVLIDGAGHVPPLEARVPAINEWLDQTLGTVRMRR